jgi:hypothetical protein
MALPPLLLAKGTTDASRGLQKALTGDLYVKRCTSVKKRPKNKGGDLVVDHELHVNPMGVAIAGAVGTIGLGALALGAYLFGVRANVKSGTGAKRVSRIMDVYAHTHGTIVDSPAIPAWDEELRDYYLVDDDVPPAEPPPTEGGGGTPARPV